ncbi:MAG: VOC family protein [Verrucomicrobiaceae bacterium]|nr:VOC family protein [Verrucomicrobiaceae bacterium]
MKLQQIKYLLLAQNMERAVKFYQTVFGLEPGIVEPFWSELSFNGAIVALHGGGDGSPNNTDLSFQVDNIVAACRIIKENGGTIISEPDKRPDEPIVLAMFKDPEGNKVMLTQYVG